MVFTITYDASYLNIEAFYPFEDWDEEWEGWENDDYEVKLRSCIKAFIDNRFNDEVFLELLAQYKEENDYGVPKTHIFWNYGKLSVGDNKGNIIYENPDHYFQDDLPAIKNVVDECISKEFCVLKIYESNGRVYYSGGYGEEFNMALMKYVDGELYYGDSVFEFGDGDGMSSYFEVYKNGELLE